MTMPSLIDAESGAPARDVDASCTPEHPAFSRDKPPAVSVIIPMYNEESNVDLMCDRLRQSLATLGMPWEVLFIDDGSRDRTAELLTAQALRTPGFRFIKLRRNFGQTAAIMAGIDHARGEIIVPLDGDLQNDPADIAMLIAKMEEGYDVVSGWRRNRQDASLKRVLPSRIANGLISRISGVHLHDYGCTLKAYKRSMLTGFRLYGEMHRFVPIFASWQGARVVEMPVNHHPRRFGSSKYGLERIFKVLLDLMVVKFLTQYETKPIYVFGGVGMLFLGGGTLAGLYALWLKLVDGVSFILTPLPLMCMFGFIAGLMCMLLGLLAEVLVRIYFESQGKTHYAVDSITEAGADTADSPPDHPEPAR